MYAPMCGVDACIHPIRPVGYGRGLDAARGGCLYIWSSQSFASVMGGIFPLQCTQVADGYGLDYLGCYTLDAWVGSKSVGHACVSVCGMGLVCVRICCLVNKGDVVWMGPCRSICRRSA